MQCGMYWYVCFVVAAHSEFFNVVAHTVGGQGTNPAFKPSPANTKVRAFLFQFCDFPTENGEFCPVLFCISIKK